MDPVSHSTTAPQPQPAAVDNAPAAQQPEPPKEERPRFMQAYFLDSFARASGGGEGSPAKSSPPLEGRTEASWQEYCEQYRAFAEKALADKRNSPVPDAEVAELLATGGSQAYVGYWSTNPGKENTPLFFQNFEKDGKQMQLYTFLKEGTWYTFDVAKNFAKAYADPSFLNGKLGTGSPLGFPDSGAEWLVPGGRSQPFQKDPEVQQLLQSQGSVSFQKFENGYLVDLGNDRVQAFKLDGTRMGTEWPGGNIEGASGTAPTTGTPASGITPKDPYKPIYSSYEIAPGVSVPTRLGVHWGTGYGYQDTERIAKVADMLKERGVGYATVLVDPANVEAQAPTIKALVDRGIQPVVRLQPSGSVNKTMDQATDAEMAQIADAAAKLKGMGVQIVQLDNEPNLTDGAFMKEFREGRLSEQQYNEAMGRYVANLSKTMQLINEKAPGMAVGFGAFSTVDSGTWEKPWNDLMWGMKSANDKSGGKLLQNAWIGVHPYTMNRPPQGADGKPDAKDDGVTQSQWLQDNARAILGVNIKTLATEGGNVTRSDGRYADPKAGGSYQEAIIGDAELKEMSTRPEMTQCLWLVADKFLDPNSTLGWEEDALISADGTTELFFDNLKRIAQGLDPVFNEPAKKA